jgi:hypothetical protein
MRGFVRHQDIAIAICRNDRDGTAFDQGPNITTLSIDITP